MAMKAAYSLLEFKLLGFVVLEKFNNTVIQRVYSEKKTSRFYSC